MIIGLTFDLVDEYLARGWTQEEAAEFDRTETIDAIQGALERIGHTVDRIGGLRRLVERLARGDRWDLVFNIAEGSEGFGREAEVPCLLEAYGIPYTFSDPLTLTLSLHKGMAKHVLRGLGVATPDFVVIAHPDETGEVSLEPPLFVKPVAEGTSKGISGRSLVRTRAELDRVVPELLERFRQPVLVERFLPGREYTVGVLGQGRGARAVAVMEVELASGAEGPGYTFFNKANYEEVVSYRLVDEAAAQPIMEVALAAWRALGCRDAGRVDLREDEHGRPNVLEVNPLAGLNPAHSDLPIMCRLRGIGYVELIEEILNEARSRCESFLAATAAGGRGLEG